MDLNAVDLDKKWQVGIVFVALFLAVWHLGREQINVLRFCFFLYFARQKYFILGFPTWVFSG